MHLDKKLILIALLTLFIAIPVIGQTIVPSIKINKLHVIGEGLLINKADMTDFSFLKIGIATVDVVTGNETLEQVKGIMKIDNETYRLNVTNLTSSYFAADVYYNTTNVGSMTLSSTLKNNRVVWVGDASINSEDFKVYILEAERNFNAEEIKDKVKEYCNNHPVMCKGIGSNYCDKLTDLSCKEKIVNWCLNNTDDTRCKALALNTTLSEGEQQNQELQQQERQLENVTRESVQSKFCENHPIICSRPAVRKVLGR